MWRYAVTVEPPAWRDITLTYSLAREGGRLIAYSDFVHSAGNARFRLGAFEPGDPGHANTRFPGFFLYQAYLAPPLRPGQRFAWSWAWQPARPGRVKRFESEVRGWEDIQVPQGTFRAARIETDILYVENEKVQARSRETMWFTLEAGIVKIVREGQAPDEGSRRIVAELMELR